MGLTILMLLLIQHSVAQSYDSYDLLGYVKDNSLLETTTGMDEFNAFQFEEKTKISAPLSQIDMARNLVTPFALDTIFRLEDARTSFLFSILHGNSITKLAVGFTPASKNIARMTFYTDILPNNNVSFILHDVKDNWQRVLFYVDKNSVSLRVNGCEEIASEDFSKPLSDVELPTEAMLYLGNSGEGDGNAFLGAVQEIKLYSKVDKKSLDFICKKEDFQLPESEEQYGNFGDFSPPPLPPPPPVIEEPKPDSCECSESMVSKIIKSLPDLRGPPGDEGPPGADGNPGITGMTGKQGEQGQRGPMGMKGERGNRGDDGNPGKDGAQGPQGKDGIKGEPGPQGPPGIPGPVCEKNDNGKNNDYIKEKGDLGPIGPEGPPGSKGDVGGKGEKGEQGIKGEKGDGGLKGDDGPRGEKGDRGEAGLDGIPGQPGTHGRSADKGEKGDRGEVGPSGPPGPSIKLTDIDPNELKNMIAVFSGKNSDSRHQSQINSTIYEKGSPGARGPVGPTGKSGPKGQKGAKGEIGDQGPKGPLGLHGPKGEFGEKGQKGECIISKGSYEFSVKGVKGERGEIGPQGEKGIPGQDCNGISGPPGPPGPPGIPGVSVTGPKGEPGNFMATKSFFGIDGIVNIMNNRGDEINSSNEIDDDDDWYATGTIIYKSSKGLLKKTATTPMGTLAYILDEKMLLIRVEHGWQYVVMGSLLDADKRFQNVKSNALPSKSRKYSRSPNERQSLRKGLYIRLAALNFPSTGKMHSVLNSTGINAANNNCYKQAKRARLGGTFAAFLASHIEDLHAIVRKADQDLPVVNTKGEVLFSSWNSIFNGFEGAFHNLPPIYSFNGRNIFKDPLWTKKIVWHGGSSVGKRSTNAFCDEWQSDSPKYYGVASSLMSNKLLGQDMHTCNSELIVLCVEVTSTESRRRQRHYMSRRRVTYNEVNSGL